VLRNITSSSSAPDCDVLATCCKRITISIEPKNEECRVPGSVGRTQSFVVRGARVRRIWNDAVERASERANVAALSGLLRRATCLQLTPWRFFLRIKVLPSASIGLGQCHRRDLASSSSSLGRFLLTGEGRK
jgi:hypothetical protein